MHIPGYEKLNIEVPLSLGIARHFYATMLKTIGIATSFIQESMGHSSASTIEHYMKSLPDANVAMMKEN